MSTPRAPQNSARLPANIGQFMGAYRNKVINGDFDIWQRGVSSTSSGYAADRFYSIFVGGSQTVSQQSHTPGQVDVPGNPLYFLRTVTVHAVSASNHHSVQHRIENVSTLAGKKATVTFYAKADAAKNIAVEIEQNFGTGGSPSSTVSTPLGLKALTTAWQRISFTIDVPSISGKTIGSTTNGFLSFNIWFDAGTTYNTRASALGQQSGTFDISHFSIVEGDATGETDPFSPRHIQQEMDMCQRYYEAISVPNSSSLCVMQATSTTGGVGMLHYRPKRVIPTIVMPTTFKPRGSSGTPIAVTSWTPTAGLDRARIVPAVASGLTAGNAADVLSDGATSTVTIDAEL